MIDHASKDKTERDIPAPETEAWNPLGSPGMPCDTPDTAHFRRYEFYANRSDKSDIHMCMDRSSNRLLPAAPYKVGTRPRHHCLSSLQPDWRRFCSNSNTSTPTVRSIVTEWKFPEHFRNDRIVFRRSILILLTLQICRERRWSECETKPLGFDQSDSIEFFVVWSVLNVGTWISWKWRRR